MTDFFKKNPFLLVAVLCLVLSCGGGTDSDSDAEDDDGSSTEDDGSSSTSTGCSDDESDELAVGTYYFVESDGDIQYRMFRSDCTYCSETLEDDETNATEDGEWTSEFTTSPELAITAGGITYDLSSDGLTLTNDAFDLTFFKDTAPDVTCGGETAD